ncbi:putative Glycoside hydrolase family 43 protein [Seiridium cardinale]|uniref:Glycoside hydrolase family 43 protein n=1 Tax=Seiridium cardinale TaxID=138064 RepID=A0ABR2XJA3_9PEZI
MSYTNPTLPGWNSDPRRIFVKELDTFICTTSSFLAFPGIPLISEIDPKIGAGTEPFKVLNDTGDRNPEGPHLYKKDGCYYFLIVKGSTETNHSAIIARATDIHGPYEGYPDYPLLTAKDTAEYFQTVGHAESGNFIH